ncbi:hypothetical protein FQR65_LT12524 [Abscondita terminalis]|nr:hypothetical protein FQR65_LT12524 [Abscondita terminalis]
MYQTCVVVLCVLSTAYADWIKELANDGHGIRLGNEVTLHVDEITRENVSIFSKHALRLNYGKYGVSLSKALDADALQLELYVKDKTEGRGKKVDQITIPAIIGLKVSAVAGLFLIGMSVLVLKSLALSNLSAAVAAGILLSKYFTRKSASKRIELEHSPDQYYSPFYVYPSSLGSHDGSDYHPYPEYDLPHMQRSETKGQYSVVEAPEDDANSTTAAKRVDYKGKNFLYSFSTPKQKFYR